MATNTKIVQSPAVALYSSLSPSGVSAIIAPYPVDLDGNKLAMSDFGSVGYATIDPKVSSYEEIISFTGITDNGNNTATLTGLSRDLQSKYPYTGVGTGKQHGSSAIVVFSNNPQVMAKYPARDNDETITGQWTFNVFPITPATPLATAAAAGMVQMSVAPADPLHPTAVGSNDTAAFQLYVPPGVMFPYAAAAAPTGFLLCDGSAVSRTTYAALFAIIGTSYGVGNGTTTFNLPDTRGRTMIGAGTGTKVATIASVAANVVTATGLTNAANNEFQTGQAVVFAATVAGNLVNATTYYVVRVTNTTFSLATSLANAQNGTVITLAGTERGTLTLTLTARTVGDTGGEENHAMSATELLSHTHTLTAYTGGTNTNGVQMYGGANGTPNSVTGNGTTGGNAAMNNEQPFFTGAWIIKT